MGYGIFGQKITGIPDIKNSPTGASEMIFDELTWPKKIVNIACFQTYGIIKRFACV